MIKLKCNINFLSSYISMFVHAFSYHKRKKTEAKKSWILFFVVGMSCKLLSDNKNVLLLLINFVLTIVSANNSKIQN